MEEKELIATIAVKLLVASITAGKSKLDGQYFSTDTTKAIETAKRIVKESKEDK